MSDLYRNLCSVQDQATAHEPWIEFPRGLAAHWDRDDEIRYNQRSRAQERSRFFRLAFDYLTDSGVTGDYHEFGCHRARTFRMALTEARRHNLDDMFFWAYDSFAGLPEKSEKDGDDPKWTPGALTTTEVEFKRMIDDHGIYTDHVVTVPGFYSETLRRYRNETWPRKIAFANIDCDLYESACDVLAFIEPHLAPGAVLYFDDWFAGNKGDTRLGVAKAFEEWPARAWGFNDHMRCGWWGRSFICVPR